MNQSVRFAMELQLNSTKRRGLLVFPLFQILDGYTPSSLFPRTAHVNTPHSFLTWTWLKTRLPGDYVCSNVTDRSPYHSATILSGHHWDYINYFDFDQGTRSDIRALLILEVKEVTRYRM